jgi:hypothetical protein
MLRWGWGRRRISFFQVGIQRSFLCCRRSWIWKWCGWVWSARRRRRPNSGLLCFGSVFVVSAFPLNPPADLEACKGAWWLAWAFPVLALGRSGALVQGMWLVTAVPASSLTWSIGRSGSGAEKARGLPRSTHPNNCGSPVTAGSSLDSQRQIRWWSFFGLLGRWLLASFSGVIQRAATIYGHGFGSKETRRMDLLVMFCFSGVFLHLCWDICTFLGSLEVAASVSSVSL